MSCQLSILSKIKDLVILKRFICQSSDNNDTAEDSGSNETDGWESNWGWGDDSNEQDDVVDDSVNDGWLHECEISVSSLGDLLAVAKDDRLALLQINYEEGVGEVFTILWKRVLSEFPREVITCVFCLPLISHKQSSQGSPEWTCIIVGFNTGHVRMYSETGTKVLDQMIHNESVVAIKCKTYSPPRYAGSSDLSEELSILYETVIVAVDGFGLFQTLRACKNRAAMAAASGTQELQLPPLGYKKWGLTDQGQAYDHLSAGTYTANPFDQLQTASIAGFREKISPVPPTHHVYACAGENPYVGIYHAIDGHSYRLLPHAAVIAAELLSVGAAKLFFWGSSFLRKQDPPEAEKKKDKIEPATPVFRRHSIQDKRRIGHSMSLSPCGRVAAVTDSLGRVILIDILRGIIRRIWKGYRNAQIGWMTVKERPSTRSIHRRSAFFLIIYAPKRGILEVWLTDNGPRVGAFNVGKGCRLIYPGRSLLGINSSTYKLVKGKICQSFLLNADGELMSIVVPFHLALSDANSKGAHDRQLMSLAKAALREHGQEPETMASALWESVSKMKLTISFSIVIEKVLSTNHMTSDTALALLDNITELVKHRSQQSASIDKSLEENRENSIDVESRLLLELCESRRVLVQMYSKLVGYPQSELDNEAADLSTIYPVNDVSTILELRIPIHSSKKVAFTDDSHLNLSDFTSLCDSQHTTLRHGQLTDLQITSLGRLMFEPCLTRGVSLDEIREMTTPLNLSVRFILNCLLQYYFSLQHPSDYNLPALETIISSLHQADDDEEITEESDIPPPPTPSADDLTPGLQYDQPVAPFPQTSKAPWWTHIRDRCEASTSLKGYMHIAIVCRSLCIKDTDKLETKFADIAEEFEGTPGGEGAPEVGGTGDPSWEHLSVDVSMWNLSLKQLEDVIALNSLLHHQRKCPHKDTDVHCAIVTVQQLKTGNRGLIGELVGRWCVANMFTPSDHTLRQDSSGDDGSRQAESGHMGLYRKAREVFPLSLTCDITHANACWEYMSQWNKSVERLFNFKFAIDYLRNIENACVRHGICVMMWTTYLVKRISWLVLLIEKVGKAPKDRLCKKEIDMDTATVTEFMGVVCDYMHIFLQANCDYGEPLLYNQEATWSEHMTGHSLVQMSCQQKETNYRLVKHHSLLIKVVSALLVFGMKSVKIMSLFDHNGSKAFFSDLYSHPYLPQEGKAKEVNAYRYDFLCRVLQHSVQSLPEWELLMIPGGLINIDKESDALKWPVIVMELSDCFSLDTDSLRKFYVEKLVSHGHDMLALEVLPFMSDPKPAYEVMFDVCCQRFSHFMFTADREKLADITSSATPLLLNWLNEKHVADLVSSNVPIADTNKLLLHILRGLVSSDVYYKHVEELYKLTTDMI